LTSEFLEDILALFRNSRRAIIFFNSLHAGASVNHIHWQGVYHKQELAIERAAVVSRGSVTLLDGFLVDGLVFGKETEAKEIFPWISQCQSTGIPFNLILIGERIYLILRNLDHEVVEEFPIGIMASMELAGKIITSDKVLYESMSDDHLRRALELTTLPGEKIFQLIEN
jgi:hypothetical protein